MSQYKLPENWDKWPTMYISISGTKRKVKYDAAESTVYLLDENGEWTGRRAKAPQGVGEKENSSGPENSNDVNLQEPENENGSANERPSKKKKVKKTRTNNILVAVIVVLVSILLFQNISGGSERTYEVIIAMENIQPGEYLTDKLAAVNISADEYRTYTSSGGIYLSSQYDDIRNFIATSFIPQDGFITYSNVGEAFYMTNPWQLNTGSYTVITIPITADAKNLSKYICGNVVTLTIVTEQLVKTEPYEDASRPSAPEVSGSSALDTYLVSTYVLNNITIVDMLDKDIKSLYGTFATYAAIPSPYLQECLDVRYENISQIKADTPAYISVLVPTETASWWDVIEKTKCTVIVSVEVTGADCATPLQDETYKAMMELVAALDEIWSESEYGET